MGIYYNWWYRWDWSQIVKSITRENNLNLAFISRSGFLDEDKWQEIIEKSEDKLLCEKIEIIRGIKDSGSIVDIVKADVTDFDSMKVAIDSLRNKFKKINGVIHSAGIAGAGYIVRKDEEHLENVLAPKVYGTWNLDLLTRSDKLDFFIMFSSAITVSGEAGQGDYVAANAFLDAYSSYRKGASGKTLTINWIQWKSAGMSVAHGINVDSIFKALPTIRC